MPAKEQGQEWGDTGQGTAVPLSFKCYLGFKESACTTLKRKAAQ